MSRSFYWILACLAARGQPSPSPAVHGCVRSCWRSLWLSLLRAETGWGGERIVAAWWIQLAHGHRHSKLKQHLVCRGWISPPPPQQHQKLSSLYPILAHLCASWSSATQAQMFPTGLAFNSISIKQLGLEGTLGGHPVQSPAQSRTSHKTRPAQITPEWTEGLQTD